MYLNFFEKKNACYICRVLASVVVRSSLWRIPVSSRCNYYSSLPNSNLLMVVYSVLPAVSMRALHAYALVYGEDERTPLLYVIEGIELNAKRALANACTVC